MRTSKLHHSDEKLRLSLTTSYRSWSGSLCRMLAVVREEDLLEISNPLLALFGVPNVPAAKENIRMIGGAITLLS